MKTIQKLAWRVVTGAMIVGLAGCSGMSRRDENTAIGAGIGAVGAQFLQMVAQSEPLVAQP